MGKKLIRRKRTSIHRKNLSSVINNAIRKNENKKVETKRLMGLFDQVVNREGYVWSLFGDHKGGTHGAEDPGSPFEISLFQGVSAVGTNQEQFDNATATSASIIKNYPANMNLSMIGDECFLKGAHLRYRLVNNGTVNYTVRVCIFETYDLLRSFHMSDFFEYAHINYKDPGGNFWDGGIMASVNRRRVKRVYHDRTYNATAKNQPEAILSKNVYVKLNKKLIAPVQVAKASSGFAMTNSSTGGGLPSLPLPTGNSAYPEIQQKELLTPHIYIVCMTSQPIAEPLPFVQIQACWTVRYTDQ